MTFAQFLLRVKSFFRGFRALPQANLSVEGLPSSPKNNRSSMNRWYQQVAAETTLTQGDFIADCPTLIWRTGPLEAGIEDSLENRVEGVLCNLVVMTQACDLSESKVQIVTLCEHFSIEEYQKSWKSSEIERGQTPSNRAWDKHWGEIESGKVWHKSMLNADADMNLSIRIVDFYHVVTLPREFIEKHLNSNGSERIRLLAPYREYLSQAFARFYMRVGLPTPINKDLVPKLPT